MDMDIDFNWLEEKIFSRILTDAERTALKSTMTVEQFTKGDVVILQQETGGKLYLLKSGRVDVILRFNGESLKLTNKGEGAQLGNMSFIDNSEACASIIAHEDCLAYRITRDDLSQLFTFHQNVAKDIMFSIIKDMSGNLRHMNDANAVSLQYIQGRRV